MKSTLKDWFKIMVLLADEAIVLVLVLLALWYFKISIPVWLAVVGALLLGIFVFITHKLVIPSFHKKEVTGSKAMIGLEGKVVEPLNPLGVVRDEDEYWKATSVDEDVAAGEDVEILRVDRLALEVKRKDSQARG